MRVHSTAYAVWLICGREAGIVSINEQVIGMATSAWQSNNISIYLISQCISSISFLLLSLSQCH